jgi:hypothetical protein
MMIWVYKAYAYVTAETSLSFITIYSADYGILAFRGAYIDITPYLTITDYLSGVKGLREAY